MRSTRVNRVLVAVSILALAGCAANPDRPRLEDRAKILVSGDHGSAASQQRRADAGRFSRILEGLQAERVYVMAGDDVLHAGLGAISRTGLAPWQTSPGLALLSSVSGNGKSVVLGGVSADSDSYSDGVYVLRGGRLEEVARPGSGYFGPTVSPTGGYAAVRPSGGFFAKVGEGTRWTHERRSASMTLSSIAWDKESNAYAIVHAGTKRSRLMEFARSGEVRELAALPCATNLLSQPGGLAIATKLPVRRQARCGRALVIDPHSATRELPGGWDPLTWSADGEALLLSRGHEIGLWDVASERFKVRATVEARIWMAAIVGERRR